MEEQCSSTEPLNTSSSTVVCMDCNMCEQRAESIYKHTASTLRKMYLVIAVMCVLCVLTLVTCGCTVYVYMQFQAAREELGAQHTQSLQQDGVFPSSSELVDERTSIDNTGVDQKLYEGSGIQKRESNANTKRRGTKAKDKQGGKANRRRGKRNQCKCCVRKVRSLLNSGVITSGTAASISIPTTPAGKANTEATQSNVMAAHYASYVDNDFINKTFPPYDFSDLENTILCQRIPSMNGVLCRNRTFSVSKGSLPSNVFRESTWLGNLTLPKLFNTNNGKFTALRTGLYQLYAHVVFYRHNTTQAFSLVHGRDQVQMSALRCETSDPIQDSHLTVGHNVNYKTCSATSITMLKVGDTISLVSLHADTHLDLSTGTTYIGAICVKCPAVS